MSTQSPPQTETDHQAHRQLVIERVLKRVRLSRAERVLQTRLRLAGFKASHGWQDVSFENIEPQLSQKFKTNQAELASSKIRRAFSRSGPSSPSYDGRDRSKPDSITPNHQKHLPYHSKSQISHAFSLRTVPQKSIDSFNAALSSEPRSHIETPSNPHTPEQTTKWILPCPSSQTYADSTPEDDELRDQTTAAEMMLFLATGSPSPNHRSITSVTRNQCHHVQIPPRFHT